MTKKEFERKMGLTIIKSDNEGVTQKSLTSARRWLTMPVRMYTCSVYLFYQGDPWEFLTYVVDGAGIGYRFSGFGWGYLGEGSHGLETLINDILHWRMPLTKDIPEAHTTGAWRITPDGGCHVV